jgi:hypothetical protein
VGIKPQPCFLLLLAMALMTSRHQERADLRFEKPQLRPLLVVVRRRGNSHCSEKQSGAAKKWGRNRHQRGTGKVQ